jgi:hypothetical protein
MPATKQDVADLRNEIAALRQVMEKMSGTDGYKQPTVVKE